MNAEHVIPAWVKDRLAQLPADFYGRVELIYERGKLIRIEKILESISAPTMVPGINVRRGG